MQTRPGGKDEAQNTVEASMGPGEHSSYRSPAEAQSTLH